MKSAILVSICAMLLAFTIPATAANLGMTTTLEGTVESIGDNALAILSQQGNIQQMVEFQVNSETQFEESIASLDSLRVGDKVKVEYKEEDNGKIAVSITKV